MDAVDSNRRLANLSVLGLYLVLFPACYAAVLAVDFGLNNDYLEIAAGSDSLLPTRQMVEGRPLNALISNILLSFKMDIDDLVHLRFASIVGIALVAWSVFLALVRAGWSRFQSICVGVIIGTTLPFQIHSAWGFIAPYPFAMVLSGLGFLVGERALDSRSPRMRYLLAAASVLILLAALAIYQPAAMFFWVFVAIAVLKPDASTRHTVRRFGWYCMIGFAGLLLGFIVYEAGKSLHQGVPTRTALDFQQIPAKIVWFNTHVLSRSLRFAWLHPDIIYNMFISLIVLAFMAGGGILYLRGTRKELSTKAVIAAFLLPLSYAPNLVAAESSASYRSLSSLTSLIVIYLFFAFRGYTGRLRRLRFHTFLENAVIGSIAVSCVAAAAYHVRVFLVTPQFQELEFIRSHLSPESLSRVRSIYVIRPPGAPAPFWQQFRESVWKDFQELEFMRPHSSLKSLSRVQSIHAARTIDTPAPFRQGRFGLPASYHFWTPRWQVLLLLRERFPEYAHMPVRSVGANGRIDPPPDGLVVDMRKLGMAVKWFLPGGEPILSGTPIIRSGFDVYLAKNTLTYFKNECTSNDTDGRFFLHLMLANVDDLPDDRKQQGFDHLDFEFDDHGTTLGGRCMAKIRLPSWPVLSIRTGQFTEQGRLWDGEFRSPRGGGGGRPPRPPERRTEEEGSKAQAARVPDRAWRRPVAAGSPELPNDRHFR